MNNEDLISISDLARQKNIPCTVIKSLIDRKLLTATPDKQWVYRSSVEALERTILNIFSFNDEESPFETYPFIF